MKRLLSWRSLGSLGERVDGESPGEHRHHACWNRLAIYRHARGYQTDPLSSTCRLRTCPGACVRYDWQAEMRRGGNRGGAHRDQGRASHGARREERILAPGSGARGNTRATSATNAPGLDDPDERPAKQHRRAAWHGPQAALRNRWRQLEPRQQAGPADRGPPAWAVGWMRGEWGRAPEMQSLEGGQAGQRCGDGGGAARSDVVAPGMRGERGEVVMISGQAIRPLAVSASPPHACQASHCKQ